MKKLIVFDFDGVLIDSFEIWYKINKLAAGKLGKLLLRKDYLKGFSGNIHAGLKETLKLKRADVLKFAQIKRELIKKNYSSSRLKFFSPSIKILKNLYKLTDMCIVTSSPEVAVFSLLKKNKLDKFFTKIYGLNKNGKRHTFMKLKQRYLVKNIILVTDTVGDLREAQAVKIKTCAVGWGFHSKKELISASPEKFAGNFQQLEKILLNHVKA